MRCSSKARRERCQARRRRSTDVVLVSFACVIAVLCIAFLVMSAVDLGYISGLGYVMLVVSLILASCSFIIGNYFA